MKILRKFGKILLTGTMVINSGIIVPIFAQSSTETPNLSFFALSDTHVEVEGSDTKTLSLIHIQMCIRDRSGDDSKKVLEDYYAKVEQGKYKQLYEMLDDESKKNYSQDEFIERNENIYEGIEAKNISIEITDSEDGKLKYHVNMDTLAGKAEFDNETVISDGKISWDDSFIYPTLKKDYKIRVRQDEATRGNINDRNGNMLAGEGEAYSVGLVPGKLNGENDYEKIGQLLGCLLYTSRCV